MKILIVTDAWKPQVSGIVRTLETTKYCLEAMGQKVKVVHPHRRLFPWALPCPGEPEIRLSIPLKRMERIINRYRPDAIHIATEGPLGWAARADCIRNGWRFTTSYATRWPEYFSKRLYLPDGFTYGILRDFHTSAERTMVATEGLKRELIDRGFRDNFSFWGRGVDTKFFRPLAKEFLSGARPILMYVGRVAAEKNLSAFLDIKRSGTKYVVGEGPDLERLRRTYPDVKFVGKKGGETLVAHYAAADVFVFPSKTDTFGLVLLEANACGIPVAAYPVQGPGEIVVNGMNGYTDEDLAFAIDQCLTVGSDSCRAYAERFSWEACTKQFLNNLVRCGPW